MSTLEQLQEWLLKQIENYDRLWEQEMDDESKTRLTIETATYAKVLREILRMSGVKDA